MIKQKCNICGKHKEINKFRWRNDINNYRSECKQCQSIKQSKYYQKNKNRIRCINKEWRKNNKEKSDAIYKRYRKTEKRKKIAREWAQKNRKKQQEYFVKRYHSDKQFNIAIKFRRRIYMAIRKQFTKKAIKTIELLGCNYKFFKNYIESLFTENMTWDKFLKGEIHLDHIKPCVSFNMKKLSEQKKCFHYTNLQPLWAHDNIRKGAKI